MEIDQEEPKTVQPQEQLFVDQLNFKVDQLRSEFELQSSIKTVHTSLNQKIQQQRDKICDVLRKIQGRRDKDKKKKSFKLTDDSEIGNKDREEEIDEFIRDFVRDKQLEVKKLELQKKEQAADEVIAKKENEVLLRRSYIYQFRKYLKRKQAKLDQQAEFKMYQQLDQQTEAYQKWVTKDQNDLLMYEFFFSQIDLAKKNKKSVHELQIKQFLFDNPLIMQLFHLSRENIQASLDKFQTQTKYYYNISELVKFLKNHQKQSSDTSLKSFVHLMNESYRAIDLSNLTNYRVVLLSPDQMKVNIPLKVYFLQQLETLFEELDGEKSGVVELDKFIKEIRQNPKTQALLYLNAVHYVPLGTNLMLEVALQILELELIEGTMAKQDDKYVSWNQFVQLFNSTEPLNDAGGEEQFQEPLEEVADDKSDEDYFYAKISQVAAVKPAVRSQSAKKAVAQKKQKRKVLKTDVEAMKFTIPKRLAFEKREEQRKLSPTIRQQWLSELIDVKKKEEEERYRYRPFKANRVPRKVADRALYGELLEQEEMRRKEQLAKSKDRLIGGMQPFAFCERDEQNREEVKKALSEERRAKEEAERFIFKASPMPWYASVQLFHRKKKDEDEQ